MKGGKHHEVGVNLEYKDEGESVVERGNVRAREGVGKKGIESKKKEKNRTEKNFFFPLLLFLCISHEPYFFSPFSLKPLLFLPLCITTAMKTTATPFGQIDKQIRYPVLLPRPPPGDVHLDSCFVMKWKSCFYGHKHFHTNSSFVCMNLTSARYWLNSPVLWLSLSFSLCW